MSMHDDDYKKFSTSLVEMADQVQSNLPHAKQQGFNAIGIDVSLDVAQELIKAVKYYQEPRFFGWPLSLVELYLEEEEQIPDNVFSAYQEHVNSLDTGDDTSEPFFIDEAYDTK